MARYLADLDANATLDNTDIALIEQSGIDKKVTLVEIKNFVLESVFPIGSTYLQLPSMGDPSTLNYPGTWTNVSSSYAGDFFRVEGGDASVYDGGQQSDQVEDHQHRLGVSMSGGFSYGSGSISPAASNVGLSGSGSTGANVGTPITGNHGSETRPVNQTIRIWKRTA